MARELVNLSTQNEKLQEKTKDYPTLLDKYNDLERRYDALLTMYGEKQEEADELRLDLADVKTLYRAQVNSIVVRFDSISIFAFFLFRSMIY